MQLSLASWFTPASGICTKGVHPSGTPLMSYTEKWQPSPKHCYWSEGKSCTSNVHRNLFFLTFTLCGSAWVGHVWFNPNYFFLYFKSQMLKQFTLIKLQLALKLSCINFSSIYREQDRWFKLHAIWGNARDICYRVNCLKLRFLSPFWVKDICSHAYWIRWKGFLLKWSMYRFLPLLLFGGAPVCCCKYVHFCKLQIAMCRSVTSFAELAQTCCWGRDVIATNVPLGWLCKYRWWVPHLLWAFQGELQGSIKSPVS